MILDASSAIFSPHKIRDYLLSPSHAVGRSKATVFQVLGYTQDQWQVLESDIRGLLASSAKDLGTTE